MTVVLSDGAYRVARRPHPWPRDDHGTPVPPALGAASSPLPGGAREQSDGTWSLRLDPSEWPLEDGDKVLGPAGRVWTVVGEPRRHLNWGANDVDYVSAQGALDPPEVP